MGEGCVQIIRFKSCIDDEFFVRMMVDRPHKRQAVYYHDYDDTYVIGKCHKEPTEIVGFYYSLFAVKSGHFHQSGDKVSHIGIP